AFFSFFLLIFPFSRLCEFAFPNVATLVEWWPALDPVGYIVVWHLGPDYARLGQPGAGPAGPNRPSICLFGPHFDPLLEPLFPPPFQTGHPPSSRCIFIESSLRCL